jgi:hypothetical protein
MDSSDDEMPPLLSNELHQVLIATTLAIQQTNGLFNNLFNDEDEKIDGRSCSRPGKSNKIGRKDYNDSTWGRMLEEEKDQLLIFDSDEAKTFRLRFRIPFKLYLLILDWVKEWTDANELAHEICGRQKVPVSLKLLGVLRILGRGTCLDGIKVIYMYYDNFM